jgi:hypothetical protein
MIIFYVISEHFPIKYNSHAELVSASLKINKLGRSRNTFGMTRDKFSADFW